MVVGLWPNRLMRLPFSHAEICKIYSVSEVSQHVCILIIIALLRALPFTFAIQTENKLYYSLFYSNNLDYSKGGV